MDSDQGYDDGDDLFEYDDDEDDSHLGFNPIKPEAEIKKDYDVEFKVLDPERIKKMQEDESEQVAALCGLPNEHAATLLRHFKWNKERLIERYMEDCDQVLKESGVHPSLADSLGFQPAKLGFTCEICCTEEDGQEQMEILSLSCGHTFCRDCYSQYLQTKIVNEGESNHIQCPHSGCSLLVDEKTVQTAVTNDVLSRFRDSLNRTFVDDSDWLRWCTAPGCDKIIECHVRRTQLDRIVPTVTCFCKQKFCFGCLNEDHRPANCKIVKKWKKKCQDDSETSHWIAAHTKECPKCNSTIEKNGGCNHMTCKKCKYEFCWVCMGPWTEHGNGFYNCNRFDESSSKTARDQQAKSRAQLERYLHYFNRYGNHVQSAKLANEFYHKTEKKMEEMQVTTDFSWIEVQFMKKALQVVLDCRHTLTWSYALAFYLEPGNQTVLFEDNQRDLEMAVETLNELIERPIPEPDDPQQKQKITDLKKQVLDKTEYCSRRREVLLTDACHGLQEERWAFLNL